MLILDEPPRTWLKIAGTLAWLALIVLAPPLGFLIIGMGELASGRTPFPAEEMGLAAFPAIVAAAAALISGASLLWTLWGRPPRLIRCYTAGWVLTFLVIIVPVVMLLLFAALSHPPGPLLLLGGMMMMPVPIALVPSLFLGIGTGLVLYFVLRP